MPTPTAARRLQAPALLQGLSAAGGSFFVQPCLASRTDTDCMLMFRSNGADSLENVGTKHSCSVLMLLESLHVRPDLFAT